MTESEQPFDQEQAIAEYTRLMGAWPIADRAPALRALLEQATAHHLSFDVDLITNKYILVSPEAGMTEAQRQSLVHQIQQIGEKIGEAYDEVKDLTKIYPGLMGLEGYRQVYSRLLSSFILFSEEVPDYISHATDEDWRKESAHQTGEDA